MPPTTDDKMDDVTRGREHVVGRRWTKAYAAFSAAGGCETLDADDLERFATAAYLIGENAESADAWTKAHHDLLERGDHERAARCAFWLAFQLLHTGEQARGFGWIARADRLLEGNETCVERGYLVFASALQAIFGGDPESAYDLFGQAAAIGDRFRDGDLIALARHGQGRALLRMGRTETGIRLLDEVMVAVTAGEVSSIVSGDVYCSVIEACSETFDLGRAQEWTTALNDWCESQPDVVPYRGTCLVRRSEIMQLHGQWPAAFAEAERARERLSKPPGQPALGAAYYQLAELLRLRGDYAGAEKAYSDASRHGRKPQPGLARLRVAQSDIDRGLEAIRAAVHDAHSRHARAHLLAALVQVALAADESSAARAAASELAEIASALDAPFLHATAAHALGCVLLAEGDAQAALGSLRQGLDGWLALPAPYEAALTRVRIGLACRELGDHETVALELHAARLTFAELGATPDQVHVANLLRTADSDAGPLTKREVEVLGLVATGKTNRQIAQSLSISEKTVARHISNIFTKLGLSTRAAATAYAFRHDLA